MPENIPVDILLDAFKLPPEEIVKYFESKGYRFSWSWKDTWQSAHNTAFTVAKVMRMDVLSGIRQMIDRAIKEGITFDKFQKSLEPFLKLAGWWGWQDVINPETGTPEHVQLGSPSRLQLIYNQNLQSAYMAGRWQSQLSAADGTDEQTYLQYLKIKEVGCPICGPLNLLVFPITDPFWTKFYPPNHFGCCCRVRMVLMSQINKYGYEISSSGKNLSMVSQTLSNGTTVKVARYDIGGQPVYTAPGFAYNPGEGGFKIDLSGYPKALQKYFKKDK